MPKRFLGNIMTDAPTAPEGPYENDAASGVWSLAEALSYTKGGLWPTTGNTFSRAFWHGGATSGDNKRNDIQTVVIEVLGNATDWGNLTAARFKLGGCSSATRGLSFGGREGGDVDTIDLYGLVSAGNASDFGNLTAATQGSSGLASSIRGVCAHGQGAGSRVNTIDYITIISSTTCKQTSCG